MKDRFGYIYKIVLPDNRFYIGKKESPVVVPYYFGSGTHINRWFKKNCGRKSCDCPESVAKDKGVKRQILAWASNRECLKCIEHIFVGNLWCNNKQCLNLAAGGKGGTHAYTDEQRQRISMRMKEWMKDPTHNGMYGKPAWNRGKPFSEEARKNMSLAQTGKHIGALNHFFGKKHSQQTKDLIRKKKLEQKKHWYTNSKINILSSVCPNGFVRGRITIKTSTTAD